MYLTLQRQLVVNNGHMRTTRGVEGWDIPSYETDGYQVLGYELNPRWDITRHGNYWVEQQGNYTLRIREIPLETPATILYVDPWNTDHNITVDSIYGVSVYQNGRLLYTDLTVRI